LTGVVLYPHHFQVPGRGAPPPPPPLLATRNIPARGLLVVAEKSLRRLLFVVPVLPIRIPALL
jgi:hypothetical protein